MSKRKSPIEHAKDFKGEIKDGVDGFKWASKSDINGIYKWYKYNEHMVNTFDIQKFWNTKENFNKLIKYDYKDFIKKYKQLQKKLLNKGMYAYNLNDQGQWSYEVHFVDYLWEDVIENLKNEKHIDDPLHTTTFLLTDDVYLFNGAKYGEITIQYNLIKKDKTVLYEILVDIFGKNVILPKNKTKTIEIKLNKL